VIREGAPVEIVQALEASFTLKVRGRLFRVEGTDANALGRETVEAPRLPAGAGDEEVEGMVWDRLKTCYDPEISINIVDLGLIYGNRSDPPPPQPSPTRGEVAKHQCLTFLGPQRLEADLNGYDLCL